MSGLGEEIRNGRPDGLLDAIQSSAGIDLSPAIGLRVERLLEAMGHPGEEGLLLFIEAIGRLARCQRGLASGLTGSRDFRGHIQPQSSIRSQSSHGQLDHGLDSCQIQSASVPLIGHG